MINCVIPLRVRIAGTPDGEQLDRLSDTIAQAIRARLAVAQRELAARDVDGTRGVIHAPVVRFRDAAPEIVEAQIRAAVEDGLDRGIRGESAQPHIVLAQHRSGAATRRAPARRRAPWSVTYAARFHVRLEDFVALYESRRSRFAPARDLRGLYADRLNEIVRATAWVVEPHTYLTEEAIVDGVAERFAGRLGADQAFFYVYFIRNTDRQQVLRMDSRGELAALPRLQGPGLGLLPDGRVFVRTGTRMLFVLVPVPRISAETAIYEDVPIEVPLRVRDIAFLVNPTSFERLFGIEWRHYLGEFGQQPATLHLLPFSTQRPIRAETLGAVLSETVASRVAADKAYFPRLRLLNRSTLDSLPPAARTALAYLGAGQAQVTDEQAEGLWSADWTGVYMYTVLGPTDEQKEIATFNPIAREHATELLPLLRQERRFPWAWRLLSFLTSRYRAHRFGARATGVTAFGYLLAELQRRDDGRWFGEFFDAVDGSRNGDLQYFVAELVTAGPFATHPRVLQSIRLLNRRRRSLLRHTYDVANQRILIDRDEDQPLRRGMLAFDVDNALTVTREAKQLRAPRLAALQAAVEIEGRELLGRILRGEDTTAYTQDEFALTAVGTAAQRIGIVEDDFEDLVIERTPRLRELEVRLEDGVERNYVTVDYFERVNEGPWNLVPGSLKTMSDGDFEFMLWSFRYEKVAAAVEVLSIGVSVFAVVVIAWEVGAIAFLVEAGGGWINVGLAIGISELIYIYTHDHRTPGGYLMAALDGYLFALGFRGAGLIGRALAARISTDTMSRVVLGWIAERIAVGTIGGASSAAMVLFSHDVLDIALGRKQGFSSLGDYVRHMTLGAALGILMEFAGGALQPVLRAAGRTSLDTVANFARRLHADHITATSWMETMNAAVEHVAGNIGAFMDRIRAGDIARAFGAHVEQVTVALRELRQTAVFQRVLELADVQLTRQVNEGLDKLLAAAQGRLANDEVLALLNTLRRSPGRLRAFLESMQLLDDAAARALGERGQLTAFSRADRLQALLRDRGTAVGWELLERVFDVSVTRAERYLERLLGHGSTQRDRVIDILLRDGQRVPPDALLLALDRLGTISTRTRDALDRLYASADRGAADSFLGSLPPERFAQILTFMDRLGPAFLRVPRQQLDEAALQGLDRLLSLSGAHMSDESVAAVLDRLRQTPRLRRFLSVIRQLDDATVTRLAETGQTAALGDAATLLEMVTRRGPASWQLVPLRFNGRVDAAEEFLTRLAPRTVVQQNRAIDILLDAGNVVTPQGVVNATEKLAAVSDAALAGLNRVYANADVAAMDAFLAAADGAALERLLPWLGGLGNTLVGDVARGGYLPALAASPRVLTFAMGARHLGRLFRLARLRASETPDQIIRSLEHFQDVNAAVPELLARGTLSREVVDLAALVDRPVYPGGSAQAIRNTADLVLDDVAVPVARQVLELPQGATVTNVTVPGPSGRGPDAIFTLDTGRSIGREATHTESSATTAADLLDTVTSRVQAKVDDFRANARGLNYESREVHLQVRRGSANVDFDPMLTQEFLADVVRGLRDLNAIDRLVVYDSRGNIVRTWNR